MAKIKREPNDCISTTTSTMTRSITTTSQNEMMMGLDEVIVLSDSEDSDDLGCCNPAQLVTNTNLDGVVCDGCPSGTHFVSIPLDCGGSGGGVPNHSQYYCRFKRMASALVTQKEQEIARSLILGDENDVIVEDNIEVLVSDEFLDELGFRSRNQGRKSPSLRRISSKSWKSSSFSREWLAEESSLQVISVGELLLQCEF